MTPGDSDDRALGMAAPSHPNHLHRHCSKDGTYFVETRSVHTARAPESPTLTTCTPVASEVSALNTAAPVTTGPRTAFRDPSEFPPGPGGELVRQAPGSRSASGDAKLISWSTCSEPLRMAIGTNAAPSRANEGAARFVTSLNQAALARKETWAFHSYNADPSGFERVNPGRTRKEADAVVVVKSSIRSASSRDAMVAVKALSVF